MANKAITPVARMMKALSNLVGSSRKSSDPGPGYGLGEEAAFLPRDYRPYDTLAEARRGKRTTTSPV